MINVHRNLLPNTAIRRPLVPRSSWETKMIPLSAILPFPSNNIHRLKKPLRLHLYIFPFHELVTAHSLLIENEDFWTHYSTRFDFWKDSLFCWKKGERPRWGSWEEYHNSDRSRKTWSGTFKQENTCSEYLRETRILKKNTDNNWSMTVFMELKKLRKGRKKIR